MLLKKGLSLTATGMWTEALYFPKNIDVDLLGLGAGDVHAGGNEVEIALDGVGSGLLDLAGKLGPTAQGRAVEAGNDRNVDRGFGLANVIQIAFGAGVEFAGMGKVGERFGKALGAGVEMEFKIESLLVQLLLEQGIEHDGGGAGIFEFADAADFLGERGGGGDQRRAQLHAEILRA